MMLHVALLTGYVVSKAWLCLTCGGLDACGRLVPGAVHDLTPIRPSLGVAVVYERLSPLEQTMKM
jgi:hypothetical protein